MLGAATGFVWHLWLHSHEGGVGDMTSRFGGSWVGMVENGAGAQEKEGGKRCSLLYDSASVVSEKGWVVFFLVVDF